MHRVVESVVAVKRSRMCSLLAGRCVPRSTLDIPRTWSSDTVEFLVLGALSYSRVSPLVLCQPASRETSVSLLFFPLLSYLFTFFYSVFLLFRRVVRIYARRGHDPYQAVKKRLIPSLLFFFCVDRSGYSPAGRSPSSSVPSLGR